jgi:hypothetical protein
MGCSKLMEAEVRIVRKIRNDETYLESERRHCWVGGDDPGVRSKCNEIIKSHISEIEREAVADCLVHQEQCRKCLKCLKKL